MAWTNPTTRSTGDLITASIWNTDLVNNLLYLHDEVFGKVNADGTVGQGSGFSSTLGGTSDYTVTFTTAFAAAPIVLVTPHDTDKVSPRLSAVSTTSFTVNIFHVDGPDNASAFHFSAREV